MNKTTRDIKDRIDNGYSDTQRAKYYVTMTDKALSGWGCADWTDGLAFAVAKSEEEAKELVTIKCGCEPHSWGHLEIRGFSKCARYVYGGS